MCQIIDDSRKWNLRCFFADMIRFISISLVSSCDSLAMVSPHDVCDITPTESALSCCESSHACLAGCSSMEEPSAGLTDDMLITPAVTCIVAEMLMPREVLTAAASWTRGGDPVGVLKICAKIMSCKKLSSLRNDSALCSVSSGRMGGTSPNPMDTQRVHQTERGWGGGRDQRRDHLKI